MKKLLLFTFIISGLSACSWVELAPEAEKVAVLETVEIKKCKVLGATTVSVKYEVGGFARDTAKMRKELEILARNQAVTLKGDAVVAAGSIVKGAQKYNIYRCRPQ